MKETDNNLLNIFSLGKIKHNENKTFIHVKREYINATRLLEHFSHIIVFWWYESIKRKNLTSFIDSENIDIGVFASMDLNRPNPIMQSITEILNIDHKTGIIIIKNIDIPDNVNIVDIKAYFPVEDRIENVIVPDYIKKNIKSIHIYDNHLLSNKHVYKDIYNIYQIGLVKKIKNKYFIQINDVYKEGLKGIDKFSHIKILWWFNKFDDKRFRSITLCNPPYENAPRTGIFASRSPVRPNPIGLSNVKIVNFNYDKALIEVMGIDAFDKTPVIDIKPYIPFYDRINNFKLPSWVNHWNEWKPERDQYRISDSINLIDSDFDNLLLFKNDEIIDQKNSEKNIRINEEQNEIDTNCIFIKGAKVHNLKNINVIIPHNKLTVVTGVSGSGKSSLVFDTIFAESERRFFENLSSTTRQILEQLEKPEVDQINGLLPAIAIEQKTLNRNPRSTVGTITEIYDLLRLLFSRLGDRYCPECSKKINPLTSNQIIENLLKLKSGIKFSINDIKNKSIIDFNIPKNDKILFKELKKKLTLTVEEKLESNNGRIHIILDKKEYILTTHLECPHCKIIFFPLMSSIFSYNNPEGLCQECGGLGVKLEIDPDLVVLKPELSLLDGASPWWGKLRNKNLTANWMIGELFALANEMNINLELPWNKLPENFKNAALYGTGDKKIKSKFIMGKSGRSGEIEREVSGAINHINRLFNNSSASTVKNRLMDLFMRQKTCSSCNGEKLCPEARYVKLGDKRFPEVATMTISQCYEWINILGNQINHEKQNIYSEFFTELKRRLKSLINIGLHYLTLDRSCPSLSGGEGQRIRLATQINNGLTGLLYVLDEPSIGLHPKDTSELVNTLINLRNRGNTILVVEHDAEIMKSADHLIEIGPSAGISGGQVIATGNLNEFLNNKKSLTSSYLSGRLNVDISKKPNYLSNKYIRLKNARLNNLKNINVNFPIGLLTCVTGVSGSGKSSLITKTLAPALMQNINKLEYNTNFYDKINGLEYIDKIIIIDQSSIGRTPRSNPCTYTGMFDEIRKLFTDTPEAKSKKIKINHFSFNSKEGQCKTCQGLGEKKIEMHFLPDVYITCPQCKGKRFNNKILDIRYKNHNINDILDMDINKAYNFFNDYPKISKILKTLIDVGLGYIKLGQSALTFSGGEAQRIKLAKELSKTDTGKTVYILDEPTTGLHFADIQKLLEVLNRLVESGNTVIVIEHNPDVIKNADWIIDLGPEGGENGGYIIAAGTPEEVAKIPNSYTGKFLKNLLPVSNYFNDKNKL